jgi:hypothetical protein
MIKELGRLILGARLHWAEKARHLVHSLRYEIRHHYIAMFIAYKAVFIRRLATKRNVESGNRVRRCTPG